MPARTPTRLFSANNDLQASIGLSREQDCLVYRSEFRVKDRLCTGYIVGKPDTPFMINLQCNRNPRPRAWGKDYVNMAFDVLINNVPRAGMTTAFHKNEVSPQTLHLTDVVQCGTEDAPLRFKEMPENRYGRIQINVFRTTAGVDSFNPLMKTHPTDVRKGSLMTFVFLYQTREVLLRKRIIREPDGLVPAQPRCDLGIKRCGEDIYAMPDMKHPPTHAFRVPTMPQHGGGAANVDHPEIMALSVVDVETGRHHQAHHRPPARGAPSTLAPSQGLEAETGNGRLNPTDQAEGRALDMQLKAVQARRALLEARLADRQRQGTPTRSPSRSLSHAHGSAATRTLTRTATSSTIREAVSSSSVTSRHQDSRHRYANTRPSVGVPGPGPSTMARRPASKTEPRD